MAKQNRSLVMLTLSYKNVLLILLCVFPFLSYAQEKRLKFLSIEAGGDFIFASPDDHNLIRGEMATFNGEVMANLSASMNRYYAGVRAEIFSRNNKFSLAAGVRFTHMNSSIGKDNTWNYTTSNIFYFMNAKSETDIEYFKIKSINQSSNYVGVPVELRVYPFKPRLFILYFKLGFECNYRIKSTTTVDFDDESMSRFKNDVMSKFGAPNSLAMVANTGAGVKLGRPNKINVRFEIGPSFYTNKTSSIVTVNAGFGAQVNVVIPF